MLVSKSGWYKFGDAWIYVLSDGVLADGMQLINGVSYCFEDYVLFE
jgi:glucan-binding YG repeat protein